jgi:SH3-like domain-containing protein
MKRLSIKTFFVLPVLTLAIAPAAWAASAVSQATSAQGVSTQQVAQMEPSSCTATGDPEGVNFYLSPLDSPLTRLPIDETVTVEMVSNNGEWVKVTDSYGTIGWIESPYLYCSDSTDMGSEELDLDDLDLTLE